MQLAGKRRRQASYAPQPAPQRPRTCVRHTRIRMFPLAQGGGATNPNPNPNPSPNPSQVTHKGTFCTAVPFYDVIRAVHETVG